MSHDSGLYEFVLQTSNRAPSLLPSVALEELSYRKYPRIILLEYVILLMVNIMESPSVQNILLILSRTTYK